MKPSFDAARRRAVTAVRRGRALAQNVVRGLFIHHAFDHAATMAFYFFLGTIPLLVFCGVVVAHVVKRAGADNVLSSALGGLPLPPVAADLLRDELRTIADTSPSLAPLSLLGFLWLTSNGFHNLMDVLEILTGAQRRGWWKQRAIAMCWVAATLVLTILGSWLLLVVNTGPSSRWRDAVVAVWQSGGTLFVFGAICAIGMAAFYRIAVVHPPGVRRRVWPGTVVALGLWLLVSWVFRAYLKTIGDYAVYYGSLATVAVTLLWLYLTSLSFVAGAEVNAQLEGVRSPSSRPPPPVRAPALEL